MAASKRANAIPPAFVARQSLNDEELVRIISLIFTRRVCIIAQLFTLAFTELAVSTQSADQYILFVHGKNCGLPAFDHSPALDPYYSLIIIVYYSLMTWSERLRYAQFPAIPNVVIACTYAHFMPPQLQWEHYVFTLFVPLSVRPVLC